MTSEELLELVQAYVDGDPIQYKSKTYAGEVWSDLDAEEPLWDFLNYYYRIKPKSNGEGLRERIRLIWGRGEYDVALLEWISESGDQIEHLYFESGVIYNYTNNEGEELRSLHSEAISMKGFIGYVYPIEERLKRKVEPVMINALGVTYPVAVVFRKER